MVRPRATIFEPRTPRQKFFLRLRHFDPQAFWRTANSFSLEQDKRETSKILSHRGLFI